VGPPGLAPVVHGCIQLPLHPSAAEQKAYSDFFALLGQVLPCAQSRQSYRQQLKKSPVQVGSPGALVEWLCQMQDRLGKTPDGSSLRAEQVARFCLPLRSSCTRKHAVVHITHAHAALPPPHVHNRE
jgi:hypothetical protein